MTPLQSCFFVYPSRPPALVETIESAIGDIGASGLLRACSWKKYSDPGGLVLSEVCAGIDQCEIFVCDLTYLNTNVLFELGYATAKNKPVWITIDPSIDRAKENYDRLGFLTTVINVRYHNHGELANELLTRFTSAREMRSLLDNVIRSAQQQNGRHPTIFYLKSEINTEASDRLSRRFGQLSGIQTAIDDPQEISSQTLAWYVKNTLDSYAVAIHFLGDDRPSKLLQNLKYSFVAGMAFGFDKQLLMLAHEPFTPGMDYKDILRTHHTAAECIRLFNTWFLTVKDGYDHRVQEFERHHIDRKPAIELRSLNLGDPFAENERLDLLDYFIFTAAYSEALQGRPSMIHVGRKGTGKTANLVKLADDLRQDRRYHVCVIVTSNVTLE